MKMKDWRNASLREIVEQLEWCGYACEAGKLEMNIAFQELKRRGEENDNADSEYIALSDIDTTTIEGRLLFAILADVTSRPRYTLIDGTDKPSETWHPNDALNHYKEMAREIFVN